MFGGSRRRRPPPIPLSSAAANPNATTAAASAYMSSASYNPNKALSSAAAAAALRARPHTPTNVAEVQTKRTMRRSASMSSTGSGPGAPGSASRPYRLERPGSSASMTERTFRSPSPHRSSALATREQHPPVPQIPDSHRNSVATRPRVAGVGMQNVQTASEKMRNEHPAWYLGPVGDTSNVRKVDTILETANSPPPIVDSQSSRPGSRNSVNFSYPTTYRPQSPPTSIASPSASRVTVSVPQPPVPVSSSGKRHSFHSNSQSKQQLVYDPNSRRMVPKGSIDEAVEPQMKHITERSARRRDSALRTGGRQAAKETTAPAKMPVMDEDNDLLGLYQQAQPVSESLSSGHGLPLQGSSAGYAALFTEAFVLPNTLPHTPEPRETDHDGSPAFSQKPEREMGHEAQAISFPLDFTTSTQNKSATGDEQFNFADTRQSSLNVLEALDAIPTRQLLFGNSQSPPRQQSERGLNDGDSAETIRVIPSIERPASITGDSGQNLVVVENKPVVGLVEHDGFRRSGSNSPARQARFAPRPAENIAVRHDPLPRSASPMKSAMKHTSSLPHDSSPDKCSDSPDQKEEVAVPRKKPARVSFDDQGTVIVGEPSPVMEVDSSPAQSPQGPKRAWFSNLGRSRKKEFTLEDDEIMKPRPALPSFGSIRDKKMREIGERPLVRPLESPTVSSSLAQRPHSSSTMNDSEPSEEPGVGQSSDHAIGVVLSQDQTSRNAANISRFREPLPPVVTSVEGCGYSSESLPGSDDDDDVDDDDEEYQSSASKSEPSPITASMAAESEPSSFTANMAAESGSLPIIASILEEPPALADHSSSSRDTSNLVETPASDQETLETTACQQQSIAGTLTISTSSINMGHSYQASYSPDSPHFDIPGGYPYEADISDDSQISVSEIGYTDIISSQRDIISEPATAVAASDQGHTHEGHTHDDHTPATEAVDLTDDASDESIYSDAYETLPNADDGGFLSLNAVVQDPTNEALKTNTSEVAENMLALTSQSRPDVRSASNTNNQAPPLPPSDASDWEQAKAFWRSLTAEKRRQLELEAAEEAGAEGDREDVSQPARRNSTKKQLPEQMHSTPGNSSKPESRVQMPHKEEQVSKASSPQPRAGMRKTLRETHRETQSVVISSSGPLVTRAQAGKGRTQVSTPSTSRNQLTTQVKPTLQRRESDTSDSSFKRKHPPVSGAFAFRKTLRQPASSQSGSRSARGSGRFSLRSLSPTESSIAPSGGMRQTLRKPQGTANTEGKRASVHFPLLSRSTKGSPKDSKWSSRFEDSSGDEGTATCFRSRIHDSSEEEEQLPVSPKEAKVEKKGTSRGSTTGPGTARPAPVPELEEDSPELPDSDDGLMPSPLRRTRSRTTSGDFAGPVGIVRANSGAIGTSTLGRSRSVRGGFNPTFLPPALPVPERRGSLLGMLRRNKRVDQPDRFQTSEVNDSTGGRGETRSEQESGPKLQKKPSMNSKDNWGWQRSTSADNYFGRSATTGMMDDSKSGDRPNFEVDNSSNEGPCPLKKKKFGALRRMFKLDE